MVHSPRSCHDYHHRLRMVQRLRILHSVVIMKSSLAPTLNTRLGGYVPVGIFKFMAFPFRFSHSFCLHRVRVQYDRSDTVVIRRTVNTPFTSGPPFEYPLTDDVQYRTWCQCPRRFSSRILSGSMNFPPGAKGWNMPSFVLFLLSLPTFERLYGPFW